MLDFFYQFWTSQRRYEQREATYSHMRSLRSSKLMTSC